MSKQPKGHTKKDAVWSGWQRPSPQNLDKNLNILLSDKAEKLASTKYVLGTEVTC
jgi:hypothetical protein